MHKDEAAQLFGVIADPNRVKALKFLYNLGPMSKDELFDLGANEKDIQVLKENELIFGDDKLEANKELIDSLLGFIQTRCAHMG